MQTLPVYLSGICIDESHIIHTKGAFVKQLIYNISPTSKLYIDISIGVKRCKTPHLSIEQIRDILLDIRREKGVCVAEIIRNIIIADGIVSKATGCYRSDDSYIGAGADEGAGEGAGEGARKTIKTQFTQLKSMFNFGGGKKQTRNTYVSIL